jgi:hypothetical protein
MHSNCRQESNPELNVARSQWRPLKRTIAQISNNEPTTVLCIVFGDFFQCKLLFLCLCGAHGDVSFLL